MSRPVWTEDPTRVVCLRCKHEVSVERAEGTDGLYRQFGWLHKSCKKSRVQELIRAA